MTEPEQPIARAIAALAASHPLGEGLTTAAFEQLMRGEATSVQAAALLTGLRVKGETAEEIAGAVHALRGAMLRVPIPPDWKVIDTCGTGGGAVSTFNVSTAAALVAVAAGAPVAKHGNRSFTSKCGSADIAEALGLPVQLEPRAAAQVLEADGMVFLFAPLYHPAMRFVAPVRRELAIPTVMNLIGPLANPAGVRRQVIGVADPARGPLLAHALCRLGAEHALVVHAQVGMDEIAPAGPTSVWEVVDREVHPWTLDPGDYGLEEDHLEDLAGGDPAHNAERIRRLLAEPRRDRVGRATVLLNAGAGLYVAGLASSLREGVERSATALDEGRAARTLERLAEHARLSTSA
ncbi:MAG: anthranilate phosphoribosyltransferase [Gemmatimonadetes bacterium]|nr:anthranilate phosphoribosyltransferase [Gemmatimonadota bacterium]MBI2537205.1 anthranilate phosphoribosyltransferase [Gemmatimonadota bacterium]